MVCFGSSSSTAAQSAQVNRQTGKGWLCRPLLATLFTQVRMPDGSVHTQPVDKQAYYVFGRCVMHHSNRVPRALATAAAT